MQNQDLLLEIKNGPLNNFPFDIVLAEPVFNESNDLTDLSLAWMNEKLISRQMPFEIGMKLSDIKPALVANGWLKTVALDYALDSQVSEPRKSTIFGDNGIPYELIYFWFKGIFYAQVTEINPRSAFEEGVPFALQVIIKSLRSQPYMTVYTSKERQSRFGTDAFLENIGLSQSEFDAKSLEAMVYSEDLDLAKDWLKNKNQKVSIRLRINARHGGTRWIEMSQSDVFDLQETKHGNLLFVIDVNAEMEYRLQLEELMTLTQENFLQLRKALDMSRDGFALWSVTDDSDSGGFKLDFINAAGAKPTGLDPDHLIGRTIAEALPVEYENLAKLFRAALSNQAQVQDIVDIDSEKGWVGAYQNVVAPLSATQVVATFRDISHERHETKRLEWLVDHDFLTGLPNRKSLEAKLELALQKLKTSGRGFGFAYIDLDDFKEVNDSLGHEAGDELLREFAQMLANALETNATAFRVSGDEFAILVDQAVSSDYCHELMERLLSSAHQNFWKATKKGISFSAGMAWVSRPSIGLAELLRVTDKAMYESKHLGKDRCKTFVID